MLTLFIGTLAALIIFLILGLVVTLARRPSAILSQRDRDREHGRGNPFVFESHCDG